ncbi:MAG: chromate reductase [Maribacter sp.]|jgi:chromate reductase
MITIISGTNRKNSNTAIVAQHYADSLRPKTSQTVNLVSLEEIQHDLLHGDMYNPEAMKDKLKELQDSTILPAEKFIFVIPEYNGSYPGIVKLFLDAISVRNYKGNFAGKKALLVGVASGRAGCLRGMDHLNGTLNHVGVAVHPNKLPLSAIESLLDENQQFKEDASAVINTQIEAFLQF